MTELRGWSLPSLPEQHLMPDAVVAFVDGELSPIAHDRAASHLARCPFCAAEAATQRHARSAMRAAPAPSAPAGLLASLMSIPQDVELPSGPDNLAVTEDGQLVTVLKPGKAQGVRAFGSGPAFGSSQPLGSSPNVLGTRRNTPSKRTGAGIVVSGLVLGALAIVTMHGDTPPNSDTQQAPAETHPAVTAVAQLPIR
jgi:anti-sigma factor RsiW